ncbi:MAG: hypothetical protein H5T95_07355 [Firmicutes bacterium]|nr:hypothetical protein [Bacillota bacterium]
MRKSRFATIILACLIAMVPASGAMAQGELVDTAAFMDIGLGARAMGMGGAFVSIADDATCVYYNPAGLAIQDGRNATSFYTNQLGVAGYFGFAYAQPRFGAGVLSLTADVQGTDEYANPTEAYTLGEKAFLASAATTYQGLHLGGTVKYYSQSLPDLHGSGVTCDLGVLYRGSGFNAGIVGRNLGGAVRYSDGTTDAFERVFAVGVSGTFAPGLTLAADYETNSTFHVGGEYVVAPFTLRGGAVLQGGHTSFTAGLGLKYGMFQFDYAYQTHETLQDMHRLSVNVRF